MKTKFSDLGSVMLFVSLGGVVAVGAVGCSPHCDPAPDCQLPLIASAAGAKQLTTTTHGHWRDIHSPLVGRRLRRLIDTIWGRPIGRSIDTIDRDERSAVTNDGNRSTATIWKVGR